MRSFVRSIFLTAILAYSPLVLFAAEKHSGIDPDGFDNAVRPQDDLFLHVNGRWLLSTEIPADKSNYGSFTALDDAARENIRAIIDDAAKNPNDPIAKKVGDFYRSYMNEELIEKKGLEPLKEQFAGRKPDATEENIQARCRGLLLMAISNKTGRMLLTTGNKSELAVGYATLYGDMNGGFAPIKDCSKMLVYRLARFRNELARRRGEYGGADVIPRAVIEREPSAELRPDQKDTDSLPAYEILDAILEAFIEEDLSVDEIVSRGFDRAVVGRVLDMVKRNEYKRRQAPPGIRVSRRAFGRDWRYPITSGYQR